MNKYLRIKKISYQNDTKTIIEIRMQLLFFLRLLYNCVANIIIKK